MSKPQIVFFYMVNADKLKVAMRLAPCNHFYCPNCVKANAAKKAKPTCTGHGCRHTHNPPPPEYHLLRPADVPRVEQRVFHISSNNMTGHISKAYDDDPGLFEVVIGVWNGPTDTDLDTVLYSSSRSRIAIIRGYYL